MEKRDDQKFPDVLQNFLLASSDAMHNYMKNLPFHQYFNRDFIKTCTDYAKQLNENPLQLVKLQQSYFVFIQKQIELWKELSEKIKTGNSNDVSGAAGPSQNGDKRFTATAWEEYPYIFEFIKRSYLLYSDLLLEIVNSIDTDNPSRKKILFYTRQYLDALSPSNFILTNPEVLRLIRDTGGKNLVAGYENFMGDLQKGRISQTDDTAFEVGKNLAITPGNVVFENELIQLIQYSSTTGKVHEIPLLIFPPWINKYYILDLEPGNSFVKYFVDHGFTVFMISWKNPKSEKENFSWDDYLIKGAFNAIRTVQAITGSKKINALGYCIGGTLLGIAASILRTNNSAKKATVFPSKDAIKSVTFLAAMHDFSDIGPMSAIIDEEMVSLLEKQLENQKIMSGHSLEDAFNMIRANDLIWNYVVNNYFKGNKPAPFPVLYWSNDNTNLPGKMYSLYLREMVLKNRLIKPGELIMAGVPVDMKAIDVPACIVGSKDDHISPCRTVFNTASGISGDVEFVLGCSGHVMGIVNPPSKKKYGYYVKGKPGNGFDAWLGSAQKYEGSWWAYWEKWLAKHSGKKVKAPTKTGHSKFKNIEAAPGRYVKEKI